MLIQSFTLGDLMTNAYVLYKEGQSEALIFDLPSSPQSLFQFLEEKGLTPLALYLTHAHADHIGGIPLLKQRFPNAPVFLHGSEKEFMVDPILNLSAYFPPEISLDYGEEELKEGPMNFGLFQGELIHTPGHSPGGCCFYFPAEKVLIAGDTLFFESVGRYDFPTSDGEALFRSIKEKLFSLPEDIKVYPGHGRSTTIGHEKKHNPFV